MFKKFFTLEKNRIQLEFFLKFKNGFSSLKKAYIFECFIYNKMSKISDKS